ncbi:MAG: ATP-binding cassette domain-containing protein [Vicinamibacterales bacterium]|nr:ATP-binding cassette domain-containing protein [Vicinamibacterales bacterium]
MPLVTLDHLAMAYGHLPLLDDASMQIEARERVCVIGRNGTGKSTLLQIISGDVTPDSGSIWKLPGIRIARLVQDVPLSDSRPVFDIVSEGLGELGELAIAYHHAAVAVAEHGTPASLATLGRLQHEMDERDAWTVEQRVELVLQRLDLPEDVTVDTLSGGWKRRVLLARALVAQPDLLLLDEPTNHLDIEAMMWLETFLIDYPGSVVFVTHDRAFLQRVATRIVELDRGHLTSWPGDYATFLRKKEEWLANESVHNDKFDKRLAQEEAWLRQGIKARRTRDEGRVRRLLAMREERAARRALAGSVRLQSDTAERSGQMVFEAEQVSKSFGDKVVVSHVSTRVIRGDRIGLIGPNGAGKTTLLRMLMGEIEPDSGEVRRGANVQIAYYDQQREQLDPERTVFDTVGEGNDTVTVNGKTQHVHGYLRDFLFPPERVSSPVKALSGGERNRLLLARLFTRPANVLVLDEPTNDLDIETLELLEAFLTDWPGTLLLVSHDRAFIDDVVTSTLVFEGDGRVQEFVGGYEDWLRQRAEPGSVAPPAARPAAPKPASKVLTQRASAPRRKLSYREQKELADLPGRIEALEAEQQRLSLAVAAPDFYKEPADTIKLTLARLDTLRKQLSEVYARWDELDSRTK